MYAASMIFEDEAWNEDFEDRPVRRPRRMMERADYFAQYDEVNFAKRFSLSKESTLFVLNMIEEKLKHPSDRNAAVPPCVQLLATLRYFATGCTQRIIGDYCGFSEPTANRIIHRTSAAIASLADEFIHLPGREEDVAETQVQLYNIAKFPKAVGAIDCTHIKIKSPGGNEAELYRNRKGYFSINTQVVCDANLHITDIVARWPGSAHDATTFNNSFLKFKFERGDFGDSVLLGDSGYASRSYMLVPLANTVTQAERLYNESHIRTRNVVERCFGVWKRRFLVLALGINEAKERAFAVIVATAVLHNILRKKGEAIPPDDPAIIVSPWEEIFANGQIQANFQERRTRRNVGSRIDSINPSRNANGADITRINYICNYFNSL